MAGCQTAVSNIVMSVVVFLTLQFLTPLFKYTPNAILAAIIISAVISLVDYQAAILIWKIDKFDFIACMGAFFGVVFISVEIGLLIAVSSKTYLSYTLSCQNRDWSDSGNLLTNDPRILTLSSLSFVAGFYIFCENPITSNKAKNCYFGEDSSDNCV